MNIEIGTAIDRGIKRKGKENQDNLGYDITATPNLFVLADGMGGHSGGEVASSILVESVLRDFYQEIEKNTTYLALNDSIKSAHKKIIDRANSENSLAGMGTTIVAVTIEDDQAVVANVGDSRIYRLTKDNIELLSVDQSWVADQVRNNVMTMEEAQTHPKKNRLTMSIAASRDEISIKLREVKITPGEIILLCSDGLWGMVPESLIHSVTLQLSAQEAANKLIELANANGGLDNISVIVIKFLTGHTDDKNLEDTKPQLLNR